MIMRNLCQMGYRFLCAAAILLWMRVLMGRCSRVLYWCAPQRVTRTNRRTHLSAPNAVFNNMLFKLLIGVETGAPMCTLRSLLGAEFL